MPPAWPSIMPRFDAQIREYAYLRNAEFLRERGPELGSASHDGPTPAQLALWRGHVKALDAELVGRGATVFTRLAIEDLLTRLGTTDPEVASSLALVRRHRESLPPPSRRPAAHHHAMGRPTETPDLPPIPRVESIQDELSRDYARRLVLWRRERSDLVGAGSELDRAVQMPGWSNIWTMPIQNRVDMLSTGGNTALGVRVLGRTSTTWSRRPRRSPRNGSGLSWSAVDVVADPIRGKGALEIVADRSKAAKLGVSVGDLTDAIESALGGRIATTTVEASMRDATPLSGSTLLQGFSKKTKPRPARSSSRRFRKVRTAVRGSSGWPRSPTSGSRSAGSSRDDQGGGWAAPQLRPAQRPGSRGGRLRRGGPPRGRISARSSAPTGVSWSCGVGQYEHEARARRTLALVLPLVLALIFAVLYWTYRDSADALLMLLAVPGSIAGGLAFQWLLGFPFTVTTWVGYIACFGMATSTGIIMLVYLRGEVVDEGRRPRSLEPGRAPRGRYRGGGPSTPAEAPDRGDHDPQPRADALGGRPRGRCDPPDGRAGPRRAPRRRRGHRPAAARPLLSVKVPSVACPSGPTRRDESDARKS